MVNIVQSRGVLGLLKCVVERVVHCYCYYYYCYYLLELLLHYKPIVFDFFGIVVMLKIRMEN